MLRRDRFPAAMLDANPGVRADRLESHVDMGNLVGRECCLAPGEGQRDARLPCGDPAYFENLAILECLGEASADLRLEGQHARRARRESEQRIGPPPCGDFPGKHLEGALRSCGDAQRYQDARRHGARSRYALKAPSCAVHSCSVCSSQAFRSAIGSGLKV
jgi:hypothetical protein